MKNSLQGIVFDFDGTLFNSEPIHFEAYQVALKPFGLKMTFAEYEKDFLGFEDSKFFLGFFKKHGQEVLAQREMGALLKSKAKAFLERASQVKACPEALEFVQKCSEFYPLAICSGAYKEDINAVLNSTPERRELKKLFKAIITSSDTQNPKPDPEGYRLALSHLNLNPENALAFEDSLTGLRAAKGAGIKVIALTHSHPKSFFNGHTPWVFEGYRDLKFPLDLNFSEMP
jgi:beta-phosphoglucomutase